MKQTNICRLSGDIIKCLWSLRSNLTTLERDQCYCNIVSQPIFLVERIGPNQCDLNRLTNSQHTRTNAESCDEDFSSSKPISIADCFVDFRHLVRPLSGRQQYDALFCNKLPTAIYSVTKIIRSTTVVIGILLHNNKTNVQNTPPTPTRRNCRVASCRRCEHTRRQSWPSLQLPVLTTDKWRHNDVIVETKL